jgi:hypothetical protein
MGKTRKPWWSNALPIAKKYNATFEINSLLYLLE